MTGFASDIALAPGCREQAVCLRVDGQAVRGNLVMVEGRPSTGLLILPGWGGGRGGPHNLLTALARAAGAAGFPSLRFDFRGRGESDGEPSSATLATMAEDSLAAAAALKERAGIHTLLLVGMCSGGNVGIGVLDRLPDVTGMYLLSVYPFGEADSFARDSHRAARQLKEYWHKLWRKDTWRRLWRGEIDVRAVVGVATRPLRRFGRRRAAPPAAADGAAGTVKTRPLDNLLRDRPPLLMIYGEADPDYAASRQYYEEFARQHDYPLALRTLAGANHNFYSLTWKQQLQDELLKFIKEHA